MAPAGVLTVADLLNRNPRVPAQATHDHDEGPATVPAPVVTVSSLLEREGLTPPKGQAAQSAPVRGSTKGAEAAPAKDAPESDAPTQLTAKVDAPKERKAAKSALANPLTNRANLRRGAVAAGTLLAAGSVFGVSMIASPTTTSNNEALGSTDGGAYPGQGILDDGPANSVLPPEAVNNPLDPGTAPPAVWTPVAFPSITAGIPQGPVADSGSRDDGGSTIQASNNGDNGSTGGTSRSAAAPGAANDGGGDDGGSGGGAEESGGGVVETLGNTVTGVTDGLTSTLSSLVGDDGGSGNENAGGGDEAPDVQAAAPAAKKSSNGGLLAPVTNLLFDDGSTSAPQTSNDSDDSGSRSESSDDGDSDGGDSDGGDSDNGGSDESNDSGGSDNGGDSGGGGGGGLLSGVGKTLGGLLG